MDNRMYNGNNGNNGNNNRGNDNRNGNGQNNKNNNGIITKNNTTRYIILPKVKEVKIKLHRELINDK